MVWRHPDVILNELEPSVSELDEGLLTTLRGCPSRLRPFPEHLLVSTGVSVLRDKLNRDPMFMRGDHGIKLQVLSFMFTPNCRNCPLA
ncbi:hypothetical protein Hanom_Chr08g00739731 [Helianthus anomalus]